VQFFKPFFHLSIYILAVSTSYGLAFAKKDKYQMKYSHMDVNHDGIVTRVEWRGAEILFHSSDWNGDGVLSGNEAEGGARRGDDYDRNHSETRFRNLNQNKDSVVSRDEWDGLVEAFYRLDDNRDGTLTRNEFVDHRVEGTDRFTELDRDGNGYISQTEWNGSAAAFKHLENNHDGQLSRGEFVNPLIIKK
jgi:hypothetical protein